MQHLSLRQLLAETYWERKREREWKEKEEKIFGGKTKKKLQNSHLMNRHFTMAHSLYFV